MSETPTTILCVDDDPDVLFALDAFLTDAGYTVMTASSAEEGLARYAERKADLIMVDLMMEEIDSGIQFVRKVRAKGDAPPIIMLSSVGDELFREAPVGEQGLDGVLQKPVDRERLLNLLDAKLQRT